MGLAPPLFKNMNAAVKTLTFAARWPNIALWGVVVLHWSGGGFRAEYVSGSERQSGSHWSYDFLIQANDLPHPLTFDDVINSLLVAPFVTAFQSCVATLSSCFASIPELPDGTPADELAVVVGPNDCGQWCLFRTPAVDHDAYWTP